MKRRDIEKLLGAALPAEATDVSFYDHHPSSELSFHTAYIKFRVSKEQFTEWTRGLHAAAGDAENKPYLPVSWAVELGVQLDWWDPGADTPPDAVARSFGANGWLVAKHERGWAYAIATDTGHGEQR